MNLNLRNFRRLWIYFTTILRILNYQKTKIFLENQSIFQTLEILLFFTAANFKALQKFTSTSLKMFYRKYTLNQFFWQSL